MLFTPGVIGSSRRARKETQESGKDERNNVSPHKNKTRPYEADPSHDLRRNAGWIEQDTIVGEDIHKAILRGQGGCRADHRVAN